jgi:hypothetical protein
MIPRAAKSTPKKKHSPNFTDSDFVTLAPATFSAGDAAGLAQHAQRREAHHELFNFNLQDLRKLIKRAELFLSQWWTILPPEPSFRNSLESLEAVH